MPLPPVRDNRELCQYLLALAERLQAAGNDAIAVDLERAARFASGSASEFLHEAQQALMRVSSQEAGSLNDTEIRSVQTVAEQIRSAFDRIGGA